MDALSAAWPWRPPRSRAPPAFVERQLQVLRRLHEERDRVRIGALAGQRHIARVVHVVAQRDVRREGNTRHLPRPLVGHLGIQVEIAHEPAACGAFGHSYAFVLCPVHERLQMHVRVRLRQVLLARRDVIFDGALECDGNARPDDLLANNHFRHLSGAGLEAHEQQPGDRKRSNARDDLQHGGVA